MTRYHENFTERIAKIVIPNRENPDSLFDKMDTTTISRRVLSQAYFTQLV